MDTKKHLAVQGKATPELTPLDEKLAGIIGESLFSVVVTEAEGHTDVHDPPDDSGRLCNLYTLV